MACGLLDTLRPYQAQGEGDQGDPLGLVGQGLAGDSAPWNNKTGERTPGTWLVEVGGAGSVL